MVRSCLGGRGFLLRFRLIFLEDELRVRLLQRTTRALTVTAEGAEDILARLEAGGVLRPLQASGSTKGGPRRRRWAVHPELAHPHLAGRQSGS